MSTKTYGKKTGKKQPSNPAWRKEDAGPKQTYWITRCLAERKVGIALRDQANAALANPALKKGEASDLLDLLFKCDKIEVAYVGTGVYYHDEHYFVVVPNKKYLEDPTQQGANLYSMALVGAPCADGIRYQLVYDPESRARLHAEEKISKGDEALTALLPKCSASSRKTLLQYL